MALDRSAIFGSRGYSRCALGRRESARAKILMEVVTLPRSHFPMKSTIFLGAEEVFDSHHTQMLQKCFEISGLLKSYNSLSCIFYIDFI